MNTAEHTAIHGAHPADPEARRAFGTAKMLVILYGLLSAATALILNGPRLRSAFDAQR